MPEAFIRFSGSLIYLWCTWTHTSSVNVVLYTSHKTNTHQCQRVSVLMPTTCYSETFSDTWNRWEPRRSELLALFAVLNQISNIIYCHDSFLANCKREAWLSDDGTWKQRWYCSPVLNVCRYTLQVPLETSRKSFYTIAVIAEQVQANLLPAHYDTRQVFHTCGMVFTV